MTKKKSLSLYFHFPFCRRKCNYCAFFSQAGQEHFIPSYIQAVITELHQHKADIKGYEINSVYFGGGTPSVVDPSLISQLLTVLRSEYKLSKNCEITLEANPETVSQTSLNDLHNAGINRLSLGLQAWQDRILEYLGREYNHDTFVKAYEAAKKAGFVNSNIDCIFGIPGQTMKDWTDSQKSR